MKSGFAPTRVCPHRMCRLTHKIASLLITVTLVETLATDALGYLMVLIVSAPLVIAFSRTKFFMGLFSGRLAHQTAGADGEVHFDVDRRWARVAVVCDVVYLALIVNGIVHMALHPHDDKVESSGPAAFLWTLLAGTVSLGFLFYAHYRATRPRPRRRVRLRILQPVPAKG